MTIFYHSTIILITIFIKFIGIQTVFPSKSIINNFALNNKSALLPHIWTTRTAIFFMRFQYKNVCCCCTANTNTHPHALILWCLNDERVNEANIFERDTKSGHILRIVHTQSVRCVRGRRPVGFALYYMMSLYAHNPTPQRIDTPSYIQQTVHHTTASIQFQ